MLRLFFICALLTWLFMVGCSDSTNHKSLHTEPVKAQPATGNRMSGQYIVILKEEGDTEILYEVFAAYGIKSIKDLSKARYLITLDKDPGPEEITKEAATNTDIKHVQPNYIYRTMPLLQDDPQRPR